MQRGKPRQALKPGVERLRVPVCSAPLCTTNPRQALRITSRNEGLCSAEARRRENYESRHATRSAAPAPFMRGGPTGVVRWRNRSPGMQRAPLLPPPSPNPVRRRGSRRAARGCPPTTPPIARWGCRPRWTTRPGVQRAPLSRESQSGVWTPSVPRGRRAALVPLGAGAPRCAGVCLGSSGFWSSARSRSCRGGSRSGGVAWCSAAPSGPFRVQFLKGCAFSGRPGTAPAPTVSPRGHEAETGRT